MSLLRRVLFTVLALLAFAANSVLCRLALRDSGIDPASFTSLRLLSGALVLCLLARLRRPGAAWAGNTGSALALCVYAAAFSYAYVHLSTGTGALLLFGAVQVSMIGYGLWRGERLHGRQTVGLLLAIAGLVLLLAPGITAPPLPSALLMLAAGLAWGVYSLRGRQQGDPIAVSAGNFLRAAPMAVLLSLASWGSAQLPLGGALYALASGGITSGLGYAIWYTVLPQLKPSTAASVQLSVPLLAALAGVLWLGEAPTWRLAWAAAALLGGILLVLRGKPAR